MNLARVVAAGVAATVWDSIYGFCVYGILLAAEFEKYPAVYRSAEVGRSYLPLMFAGILVAMIAAAFIYAKGYEGGSGIAEGLSFGLLVGMFVVCAFTSTNFVTLNIGGTLALKLAVSAFVQWTIVGMVIGMIYKPAARG